MHARRSGISNKFFFFSHVCVFCEDFHLSPLPLPFPSLINVKHDNKAARKDGRLNKAHENKCVSQRRHLGTELMSQSPWGGERTN